VDLLLRIKELENWTSDFQLPAAVWLGGFFNPQSFLTAIMQVGLDNLSQIIVALSAETSCNMLEK